jgi:hypothetical protein
MALKNMIKVGDKVSFGRSGEEKVSGTVVACNPKTARIKVPREGEFLVTYNLIQKRGTGIKGARQARVKASSARKGLTQKYVMQAGKKKKAAASRPADRVKEELILQLMRQGLSRAAAKARVAKISQTPREAKPKVQNPGDVSVHYHDGAVGYKAGANASKARKAAAKKTPTGQKPAAKRKPAAKKAPAKSRPRQKAIGKPVCAAPVGKRQCAPKTLQKNPAKKRKPTTGLKPHFTRERGLPLEERVRRDLVISLGTPGNYQYELSEADQRKYERAFTKAALGGAKVFAAMKKAKGALSPAAVALALEKAERTRRRYEKEYADPVENPYEFGQESRKVRRRAEPEWGEGTLGFATTEADPYGEEETGKWQREQTRQNPSLKEEWYFQGDPKRRYFDTKMEAEIAARKAFPSEGPARRYARIRYREVYN